jgi:hypothetical protein
MVGGESRLGVTLTSEQSTDTTDRGAWWLVLFNPENGGPSARVRRAHGPWTAPVTLSPGAALYAAGDARGDQLWIGLHTLTGKVSESRAAEAAQHCGACSGPSGWPRDTFAVTTLGHAIYAAGLSGVIDNGGRATLDVEVPLDTFLLHLDAATHQRGVWICDFRDRCDVPEGDLALRGVRVSGSGARASLTMQVQRRRSALSGGWGPTYVAEASVSTRMEHSSFMLSSIEDVSMPGADRPIVEFLREGLLLAVNYPLFPSFSGVEGFVRRFGTTCLSPETERARVQQVVTTADALRLRIEAPVNIQAHLFCPPSIPRANSRGEAPRNLP